VVVEALLLDEIGSRRHQPIGLPRQRGPHGSRRPRARGLGRCACPAGAAVRAVAGSPRCGRPRSLEVPPGSCRPLHRGGPPDPAVREAGRSPLDPAALSAAEVPPDPAARADPCPPREGPVWNAAARRHSLRKRGCSPAGRNDRTGMNGQLYCIREKRKKKDR
jgi:hypothetical protein